jgi:MarR family 2-MHQ and catechol resistance regulon transcriptional repressor
MFTLILAMPETSPAPALLSRAEFYRKNAAYLQSQQPDFELETAEMFFSLVFAYDTFTGHFARRMQRFGLTLPTFNLLMILNHPIYRETGCPLSHLGELLLVSKANITGVMDSLQRRGLAERVDASYDRRVKLAQITETGCELLERVIPGHLREAKRIFAGIDPQEKKQIRDLLRKMRQVVLDAGEEPDDEG